MSSALLFTACGGASGVLATWAWYRSRFGSADAIHQQIVESAERAASERRQRLENEYAGRQQKQQAHFDELWEAQRQKISDSERRLQVDKAEIEAQRRVLQQERHTLAQEQKAIKEQREQLREFEGTIQARKEELAGLTPEEAAAQIIADARRSTERECDTMSAQLIQEATSKAQQRAQSITANAIGRLAYAHVRDTTTCTILLPSEELKGRVIGREGRNIRAFEQATGVTLSVDDDANALMLSAFDPVRRHVAAKAMRILLRDGRIHPSKIEEVTQETQKQVEQEILDIGTNAAIEAGVEGLDLQLRRLVGKMHFRTTEGQNLLQHSLEVAALLSTMAAELQLDQQLAARIGLLHDIGKAVSHKIPGSHALVGRDLALKYGESPEVANGIACHHGEVEPCTVEGSLCSAADTLSAARPGARQQSIDEHIQRLRTLEEIAREYPGVDTVYALHSGQEIRVSVLPDMIDDRGTHALARDLAKRIRKEIAPGAPIQVTVVRERRAHASC